MTGADLDPAAGAPEENEPSKKFGGKLAFSVVFGLLVYAGYIFYADADGIARALEDFSWSLLLVACALSFANYVVRFARWQRYLKLLDIQLPLGRSFTIYLAGLALTVTPGKMGETFKSWLIRAEEGTPVHKSAPIVLAERFTDLLGFLILIAIGGLYGTSSDHSWVFVATLGLCGVMLAFASSERLGRFALGLLAKLPGLNKIADKLESALESTRVLLRPRELVMPTLVSALGWGLECVSFWMIANELVEGGCTLAWATYTFALSAVAGAVLILFPGGLGPTEASMGSLLSSSYQSAGLTAEAARANAVSATILTRLCTLWFAVLVGLVATAVFRRGQRERAE